MFVEKKPLELPSTFSCLVAENFDFRRDEEAIARFIRIMQDFFFIFLKGSAAYFLSLPSYDYDFALYPRSDIKLDDELKAFITSKLVDLATTPFQLYQTYLDETDKYFSIVKLGIKDCEKPLDIFISAYKKETELYADLFRLKFNTTAIFRKIYLDTTTNILHANRVIFPAISRVGLQSRPMIMEAIDDEEKLLTEDYLAFFLKTYTKFRELFTSGDMVLSAKCRFLLEYIQHAHELEVTKKSEVFLAYGNVLTFFFHDRPRNFIDTFIECRLPLLFGVKELNDLFLSSKYYEFLLSLVMQQSGYFWGANIYLVLILLPAVLSSTLTLQACETLSQNLSGDDPIMQYNASIFLKVLLMVVRWISLNPGEVDLQNADPSFVTASATFDEKCKATSEYKIDHHLDITRILTEELLTKEERMKFLRNVLPVC